MKRKVKILVLMICIAIAGNVGNCLAKSLYETGYDKGYFDALNKISYFVSPFEGQDDVWVKGYKEGHSVGLKVLSTSRTIKKKFEANELLESLTRVKDLYHAVSMNDDETTHEYYVNTTRKLARLVIENFKSINENDGREESYINQYVEFIGSLAIEQRDAYLPSNSMVMEYLRNGYRHAMENGTRFETRIFGEAIRKVEFLVGRGTVI